MESIIPPRPEMKAEVRRQLRRAAAARPAADALQGGLWGRFVRWLRIEREVARELNRRFPPGAFYTRASD